MEGDDDRQSPSGVDGGETGSGPDRGDRQPAGHREANDRSPGREGSDGGNTDRESAANRGSEYRTQGDSSDQRGPNGPPSGRRDGGPGEDQSAGPGWKVYVFDLVSSAAIVLLIGALLFTASGIWPPMVAVESGSMEPVMERGDLVYVMESDRFPGAGAHGETGVVTYQAGQETGYEKFGKYGDVIVFHPNGDTSGTPTIHRAMMWVEKGENWVDRANPDHLAQDAPCKNENGPDVPNCPAPYSGFITKGDHNGAYDQARSGLQYDIVKPEWVVGTGEFLVPYLGSIRLGTVGGSSANATAG